MDTKLLFRILSLDGSGIKGAFSVATDDFDLTAGASTGGVIALRLGLGKTAREIVEFSREQG